MIFPSLQGLKQKIFLKKEKKVYKGLFFSNFQNFITPLKTFSNLTQSLEYNMHVRIFDQFMIFVTLCKFILELLKTIEAKF